MSEYRNCIRFDWAAKRILRDKANFVVLEGLLSVLLDDDIKIEELVESESYTEREDPFISDRMEYRWRYPRLVNGCLCY